MKLKLLEKKQEAPDVVSFLFEPAESLTWRAGQYLHYVLHHRPTDDRGSDRWFTNSAAPFEKQVRITTRIAPEKGSTFKAKLQSLEINKDIEVTGVFGSFIVDDLSQEYVFIAGGIGITPFRSMIVQLEHEQKKLNATLLYANRDQNIVYQSEFERYAQQNPSFKIEYVFSPERIDEIKIRSVVPDVTKPEFYISGPEPMVDAMTELLTKMGVPQTKIKQDWFPGYPAE